MAGLDLKKRASCQLESVALYNQRQILRDPAFSFSMNDQALSFVDSHKHLGVIITAYLEWKVHAREVVSKGTKKLGC